jgi:hypothetical protein
MTLRECPKRYTPSHIGELYGVLDFLGLCFKGIVRVMQKEVLSIFGRILSEEDKSSVLEILTTTPGNNP